MIWRKICKHMTCKAVRQSLCGVALNISEKISYNNPAKIIAEVIYESNRNCKKNR